ncbi:hypothetical protein [Actinomycetospora soli]|uniref:hypothetical protein n=1 Tax=Actinomycetospora soli TaxID=2893887 RepID=UPI001E37B571|nr:hypothetical protein [Actinomycetospora soli]MCD2191720.1 hypothetical protein [Actinomycetospora soli]
MALFPLGRYGDNHVTPAMLFDPRDPGARPPSDAVDVQFRLPSSLNAMLDGMARAGRDDLIDPWRALYSEIAESTATQLQHGGYGIDNEQAGKAPARLEITAIMHREVPGFAVARWHLHLYIGATATSLLDGRRLPVAWDSIDNVTSAVAWPHYINQVEQRTIELWGVRWDEPRLGAQPEIVEPAWHEHVDSLDRGVCPGPWGDHQTMVADEATVQQAIKDEEFLAREHAAGRELKRAKLLFEDDDEDFPASATG